MRLLVLLGLLAITLAGCSSSVTNSAPPPHRHFLRWGVVGVADLPTLDPALASDPASVSVASLIYGGLVRLDQHLRVQPDGARRWTISPDGKTYTFYLRPKLRFASGNPVTAQDYRQAIVRALGPEGYAGPASFYLGDIARQSSRGGGQAEPEVRALDAHRLQIVLSRPAAHFLAELAFSPASTVPDPSLVGEYAENWTDHAAGFGPYMVQNWQHGRSLTLVRNSHYYGGKPDLNRIVVHFYLRPKGALAAYSARKLDLVTGMQPDTTIPGHPNGLRRIPGLALDYLAFNTTRPPFRHLPARRAFASVVSGVSHPAATFASHGFLPPVLNLYVKNWVPTKSPGYYLARAHRHGQAFPGVTMIVPEAPEVEALAHQLAQAWQTRLNVPVHIQPLNPSDYSTILTGHAYDLAIVRWGADYADPQDFLATQLGSSGDNVTGWSSPDYAAALQAAAALPPNDPQRASLFRQAARFAAINVPLVPLDEPSLTALIAPNVHGVAFTPLGTITANWVRAYVLA